VIQYVVSTFRWTNTLMNDLQIAVAAVRAATGLLATADAATDATLRGLVRKYLA
jgi:hypothetical protein